MHHPGDIIDTAGTIVKAAQALVEGGASRVFAAAVHGVLSGPAIARLEQAPLEKVIITNTIPLKPEAEDRRKSSSSRLRACWARQSRAFTRRRRSLAVCVGIGH